MCVCVCGSVICNINSVPERPKKETQKFSSSLPLNERNEKNRKIRCVYFDAPGGTWWDLCGTYVGLGGTWRELIVGLTWDLCGGTWWDLAFYLQPTGERT